MAQNIKLKTVYNFNNQYWFKYGNIIVSMQLATLDSGETTANIKINTETYALHLPPLAPIIPV